MPCLRVTSACVSQGLQRWSEQTEKGLSPREKLVSWHLVESFQPGKAGSWPLQACLGAPGTVGGARSLAVWMEAEAVSTGRGPGPRSGRSGQRVRLWAVLGSQVAEPRAWRVSEALAGTTGSGGSGRPASGPCQCSGELHAFHAALTEVRPPPAPDPRGSGARAAVREECPAICLHVQIFPPAPGLIVREKRPQRRRVWMTRRLGGRCLCGLCLLC